jgi:hypothetical protein
MPNLKAQCLQAYRPLPRPHVQRMPNILAAVPGGAVCGAGGVLGSPAGERRA